MGSSVSQQRLMTSHSQVGNIIQGVVEAVGEIRNVDDQRQFDDLSFVVKFIQFGEFGRADPGRASGYAVGIENRHFFFLAK